MRIEDRLNSLEIRGMNSALLLAQWSFDRELVTRSLNVISTVFPHYSLHESSHSISILSEIEKLLGTNIEKLSFVDAWLILEAAYWHDIGMIVTDEEKMKITNTPEFKHFVTEQAASTGELSDYARYFVRHQKGEGALNLIELEKSFTFLLAEQIRRTHPERSKNALLNPESLGIKSPQSGLINQRLIIILGDIIEAHGKPFSSVLELPLENDGLDVADIAHPRFVACLLRLGDLLDLDDGRHCPTQLKTIGKLPSMSFAHLEKHRSIVSKKINEESIEIRARCTSYESFEVQNDWFFYLESEVENQDKYWGDIGPKEYFRKPPSIKSLVCELDGSVSLGRKSSRLSLDGNRVYDFLNGKYIYENQLACVLEILQNAVDATIDRMWLESADQLTSIQSYRELSQSHRIDIRVDPKLVGADKVEYCITVVDSGKGMSIDDIRSILVVASESNQRKKESMRWGMPTWMRPSGFFGIGLQSIFALSDQLKISTRTAGDGLYDITIKSCPGKTPSFLVTKVETSSWKFGTTVTFKILDDAIPNLISGHNAIFKSLSSFDPLKDKVLNAKEAQIEEQVAEFAQYCEFPVYFNGELLVNHRKQFKIVDLENGIEYAIEFIQQGYINEWSYRGRPFKTNSRFNYFNIKGNIISERADAFLPLNREKIHPQGQLLLEDKITKSLDSMKDQILSVIVNKSYASLYYFLSGNEINEDWKSITLTGNNLGDLIKPGSHIDVSFDYCEGDILPNSGQNTNIFIGNKSSSAKVLIDVLRRKSLGIKLSRIQQEEVQDRRFAELKRKVTIYSIEIVAERALSEIANTAIEFLSTQKLSKQRTRYWLPCGSNQHQDISQTADSNRYLWISYLTPLSDLFPCGIVLRSTTRSLEKDIPDLIDAIRSKGEHLSEAQVDKALREFYDQFPFESQEVAEDVLNKAAEEKVEAAETSAKKPAEKAKKKPSKRLRRRLMRWI